MTDNLRAALQGGIDAIEMLRALRPEGLTPDDQAHLEYRVSLLRDAASPSPLDATAAFEVEPDTLDVEAMAETLYRFWPGPGRDHDWAFWQKRARNTIKAFAHHRARLAADNRAADEYNANEEAAQANYERDIEEGRYEL